MLMKLQCKIHPYMYSNPKMDFLKIGNVKLMRQRWDQGGKNLRDEINFYSKKL